MSEWSTFDEAWSAAIKLSAGWRLRRLERNGTEVEYSGGRREYVEWWEATARGPEDQEITAVGSWPVNALYQLVNDPKIVGHKHQWVDATNEVVSGGEMCPICGAIRPMAATIVANVDSATLG